MAKTKQKKSWLRSKYFIAALVLTLSVAGVVGYSTFASTKFKIIPSPCLGGTIKKGSTGSCVLAAKKALNFICKNKDLKTTNSTFDQTMKYRVLGFQSSAGIGTQDGIIGKTTWNNLYKHVNENPTNNLGCFERHIDTSK